MKETHKEILIPILLLVSCVVVAVIFILALILIDYKHDQKNQPPETKSEKASRICEEKGGIYSPGGFAAGRCDFPPQ